MGVQSLDRAFDIIELLSRHANGLTVGHIARELELHKSTTSRLLQSLGARGYVERDNATGLYRLGLRFVELAGSQLDNLELRVEARPAMYELSERSGQTAFLATLQGAEAVYIDKTESFGSLRRYAIIGTRVPLYCTALGKALLMPRHDDEIRTLLAGLTFAARTENTVRSAEKLIEDLHVARRRGYTLDLEENEPEVRCVGAPVLDYRGYPAAALSISGPSERLVSDRLAQYGALVQHAAERVSRSIGYHARTTARATQDTQEPSTGPHNNRRTAAPEHLSEVYHDQG